MKALLLTVFSLTLVGCQTPLQQYYAEFDATVDRCKAAQKALNNPTGYFVGGEEGPWCEAEVRKRIGRAPEARLSTGYREEMDRQRDWKIYEQEMFNKCLRGAGGNATVC